MLVVAQVTFQHENDEGQQWGRQLLILVVDRPNPIFCTSFSKHIWPYWKQLYKIYYVMLAWKNNLGHQHFFKRWIIKNRYGFLKWWGLGQTHSLFEYQLMLSIETKVCLPPLQDSLPWLCHSSDDVFLICSRHRIYESQLFSISSIFGHGDFKEGIHLFFWMGVVF